MAAASISKSSTIVLVTASSVASSEALGEGARDLVQPAQLAPRLALRLERALEHLAELLGALVQAGVLHGDGELARERDQKPLLSFAVGPRALLEDGERADHLVANDERHENRAADPAVLEDPVEPLQARIPAHVLDEEETPASIGAEGDLEQALRQLGVCADEAARGGRGEAFALAQVDGHVAAVRELRDALDRGVERVCKREPRDRLADDADDGLRARERDGDETDAAAPSKSESRPCDEWREHVELFLRRRARGEVELHGARRRFAERDRREGARELHAALAYRSTHVFRRAAAAPESSPFPC